MIPELSLSVQPAVAKACCLLGHKHLGFCHAWLPSQLKILPRGSPPAATRQSVQLNELLSILRFHLLAVEAQRELFAWLMSKTSRESESAELNASKTWFGELRFEQVMVHIWSALFASGGKAFWSWNLYLCFWAVNLVLWLILFCSQLQCTALFRTPSLMSGCQCRQRECWTCELIPWRASLPSGIMRRTSGRNEATQWNLPCLNTKWFHHLYVTSLLYVLEQSLHLNRWK